MLLPYLKDPGYRRQKEIIDFRGVNYGENVREGQLEESRNLFSGRFPCMSPREGREVQGSYDNATAVYYKGKRFVVDGNKLLYDDVQIGTVAAGKKQFATVNSKVVIFPDKIYYDTETGELRSLGTEYTSDSGALEIVDNKAIAVHLGAYHTEVIGSGNIGGTNYAYLSIPETNRPFTSQISSASINADTGRIMLGTSTTCPRAEDIQTGMLFISASLGADGVSTWGKVTKTYVEPTTPVGPGGTSTNEVRHYGFDYDIYGVKGADYAAFSGFETLGFRVGDAVEIEGMTTFPEENGSYIIRGFGTHKTGDGTELSTLIFDSDVFAGNGVEAGKVTVRRKVPNLTVVCESDNRLWGAEGNTIYASALGDPTNFFTYDGLDTDSYAVAVASEGDFAGCRGFGNSVLFFKEDRLYKVLGSYPSQYTMYEYQVPGVLKGSEGSLWNINEVLYYHSREGVYRYNGGSPELISENFGLRRFQNASAGAAGDRYYISMQDRENGEWGLWVYDIQRDLWLREDESQAVCFARDGGSLYFIDGTDGSLVLVNPASSEEEIEWSATLCRMDEVYHDRKCYSRLLLRADLEEGAWLKVEVACDDGPFETVSVTHKDRKLAVIPIHPNRCANFRVRLSGGGKVIVRSLVREMDILGEY